MRSLSKFKENQPLFYAALFKHSVNERYVASYGWSNVNKIGEAFINTSLVPSLRLSQLSECSVHSSLHSILSNSHRDILIGGQDEDSVIFGYYTLILSSPVRDFSRDIKVVVEERSSNIIEKCKSLGLWD